MLKWKRKKSPLECWGINHNQKVVSPIDIYNSKTTHNIWYGLSDYSQFPDRHCGVCRALLKTPFRVCHCCALLHHSLWIWNMEHGHSCWQWDMPIIAWRRNIRTGQSLSCGIGRLDGTHAVERVPGILSLAETVGCGNMDAVDCWRGYRSEPFFTAEWHRGSVCCMLCLHVRVVTLYRFFIYGIHCFGKHLSSVSSTYCFRIAGFMGQYPRVEKRTSTQISFTPSLRSMVRAESIHDLCRLVALHLSYIGWGMPSMYRRVKIHIRKHLVGLRRHQHPDIRHCFLGRCHHQLAVIPLCEAPSPTTRKTIAEMKKKTKVIIISIAAIFIWNHLP